MAAEKRPRTTKPKTTKSVTTTTPAASAAPAHSAKPAGQSPDLQQAIRARAYEIYAQRGYAHGHDIDDWLRAEVEVLSRFGMQAAHAGNRSLSVQ